jgi:hypothetical protein
VKRKTLIEYDLFFVSGQGDRYINDMSMSIRSITHFLGPTSLLLSHLCYRKKERVALIIILKFTSLNRYKISFINHTTVSQKIQRYDNIIRQEILYN